MAEEFAKRFPSFAALPKEQQTEAVVRASWREPPVVRMRLANALADLPNIRGAYELSTPNVDVDLALKYGRSSTTWLTRHPDVRKARRPRDPIVLVDLTPLQDGKGHLNMKWRVEIVEEAELLVERERAEAARGLAQDAQRLLHRRAEAAG